MVPGNSRSPATRGFSKCAEEDSNLHPVIPDQALNLVTRVSDPSYASIPSRSSGDLDGMDAMDDLDVAADVAAARTCSRARPTAPTCLARVEVAVDLVLG
jgi:hypothetical protein